MNFLIAGASTFAVDNLGDDAMLAALVQAIESAQPGSDIQLLARHPSEEFNEYFRLTTVQNLEHQSNSAASGRMFMGFNPGDSNDVPASVLSAIDEADVLILAGNLLMEITSNSHLRGVSSYAALLTTFAQIAGTPTCVFALNIVDPITTMMTLEHARHVLSAAELVSVREGAALRHLENAGIDCVDFVIGGDPAIGLVPERREREAFSAQTPPTSPRVISMCLRNQYWSDSEGPSLPAATKKAFEELLATGAHVRFIPNCTYTSGHPMEDDRLHHRILFGEYSDFVEFVDDPLGLHETIQLLSESDIHLTNRRHSAILAGHAGALPVPIDTSLSTHMSGFLNDLALENVFVSNLEAGLRLVVQIDDDDLRDAINVSQIRMSESASMTRQRSIKFIEQIARRVQGDKHK